MECKIGIIYMLDVLNWPWRLVKTNGLMPMRSVFFSSCICVYLSVHHPCEAVLPLSFIPFHLTVIQLLNLSCHVRGQLPTLWEYNKMSLLNLAASLVKVGCSVAINFFFSYISFFPAFCNIYSRNPHKWFSWQIHMLSCKWGFLKFLLLKYIPPLSYLIKH